ncbi:unnamed protein product [Cuscuta campestris]|uniref:K Homology domain-containing protein n=2 Tax=Cuscuta sect. Cleistogrammica TaxID=1824901 RepID=A0A484M138_9ASTE|nr:hypothetical protein DM860_012876 [Cuscuta australis]VFQ81846.1 unnamed protein product [Cuscuta campestris]
MQESHHFGGAYNNNYRPPPNRSSYAPTGNVAFRFLCHSSRVGGVIGKSGVIVKQLQQETSARIRVEDPGCNSENRVIVVIASAAVNRKIKFSAPIDDGEDNAGIEAEFEASAAQEAVVRVFERVLEVTAETGGMVLGNGTLVSCRLIAKGNQVGSVIGKGGTIVDAIRKETGCRIKVLTMENLPSCTYPGDKVVEIEGEILGVKKALIAVTGRFQECMPPERTTFGDNKVPDVSQESLQVNSTEQNSSIPVNISPRTGGNFFSPRSDSSSNLVSKQEITFKILCLGDKVGYIIGKGGSIVKSLEVETGATIRVGPVIGGCFERLITISAFENLESHQSPARHGVILVFNRLAGIDSEKVSTFGPKGSFISARLVVPANQAGCLLGIGGSIIAEMRKMTGARIIIHKGDQVPTCASENDEVVEITGEFSNVQDALCSVTAKLRNNLLQVKLTTENSPHGRLQYRHSAGATDHINLPSDLTQNMGNLAISNNTNGLRPPSFRPPHITVNKIGHTNSGRGLTSANGGLDLGRSAIVTNTTVEMVVSESAFGSVYGENGINLEHLRQISGAKVLVCRPSGSSNRTIVISGTPDETQTAQNLLQTFIMNGSL